MFKLIYLFSKILLALFFIRIFYLIVNKLYIKLVTFFEFIAAGSEYYWKRRWLLSHSLRKSIEYNNIDIYDSKRGWALIKELRNRFIKNSIINSNSEGARGKIESLNNNDNVLFFGDSFCFGEGVDDNETIPYFFEKKFGLIKSLNFGVHGYGIDQQYLYLEEVCKTYRPKIIFFIISYDDFNRNFLRFRDYAKPMFILRKNDLVLINIPVPRPEYYLEASIIMVTLLMILDFFRQLLIFYGLLERKKRQKICSCLLDQINQIAQELQSRIFFVYIPNNLKWPYRNYIDKFFVNFFKERKISFLNLGGIFAGLKLSSMIDSSSGHFNAKANELIADKLVDLVKGQDQF